MNKVFKVIFNKVLGKHVVVSEIVRSCTKKGAKAVVAAAMAVMGFGFTAIEATAQSYGYSYDAGATLTAVTTDDAAKLGFAMVRGDYDNTVRAGKTGITYENGSYIVGTYDTYGYTLQNTTTYSDAATLKAAIDANTVKTAGAYFDSQAMQHYLVDVKGVKQDAVDAMTFSDSYDYTLVATEADAEFAKVFEKEIQTQVNTTVIEKIGKTVVADENVHIEEQKDIRLLDSDENDLTATLQEKEGGGYVYKEDTAYTGSNPTEKYFAANDSAVELNKTSSGYTYANDTAYTGSDPTEKYFATTNGKEVRRGDGSSGHPTGNWYYVNEDGTFGDRYRGSRETKYYDSEGTQLTQQGDGFIYEAGTSYIGDTTTQYYDSNGTSLKKQENGTYIYEANTDYKGTVTKDDRSKYLVHAADSQTTVSGGEKDEATGTTTYTVTQKIAQTNEDGTAKTDANGNILYTESSVDIKDTDTKYTIAKNGSTVTLTDSNGETAGTYEDADTQYTAGTNVSIDENNVISAADSQTTVADGVKDESTGTTTYTVTQKIASQDSETGEITYTTTDVEIKDTDTNTYVDDSSVTSATDQATGTTTHTVTLKDQDGNEMTSFDVTDKDTTYTSTVTSEGLSGNQVSKLTITNDATGDKTEFFDTDTQYEGRVEFVEDGKDFGEGEVKYGIYSTTQTAKADSKQTEGQSTGGTVGNDVDAGTAATPAAGVDNTTSSTGDNSSTVTAEASGGEEITISGKELILKAGDNVKISNEEGKALITAKDTTLEKSSDALSLDGNTLTLTVRDTDGNEVTGEADLSSLAGASDFEGDDAKAVTPADGKLTIKGGADANSLTDNNIGVVADGDNGLRVKLAKNITDVDNIQVNNAITASAVNATNVNATTVNATDVKATTVTANSFYAGNNIFNSSGLSVGGGNVTVTNEGFVVQGGPSMTSSGINAGGKKITNVAAGTAPTDAVNVSQLNDATQQQENNFRRLMHKDAQLERKIHRTGAHAAALAALHPLDFDEDHKLTASAGVGSYHGSNAVAAGVFYRPDENKMFSLGVSLNESDSMVNAGFSYRFGTGSGNKTSPNSYSEMKRQVSTLSEENRSLSAELSSTSERLASADKEIAGLKDEIAQIKKMLKGIKKK